MAALQSFQKVLDLENGDKGEWGFKALKQMIKINFKLSNYNEMMTRYKQLLTYIKSAVTRNHSEKSINSILDYISTSKNVSLSNAHQLFSVQIDSSVSYIFFFRLFFFSLCKKLDGIVAKFLRNHIGSVKRCEK